MRVQILEERLKDSDPETGQRYNLSRDDVITVSDALGAAWCGRGWAKDVDGVVPTGERIVQGATLKPQGAKHVAQSREV